MAFPGPVFLHPTWFPFTSWVQGSSKYAIAFSSTLTWGSLKPFVNLILKKLFSYPFPWSAVTISSVLCFEAAPLHCVSPYASVSLKMNCAEQFSWKINKQKNHTHTHCGTRSSTAPSVPLQTPTTHFTLVQAIFVCFVVRAPVLDAFKDYFGFHQKIKSPVLCFSALYL